MACKGCGDQTADLSEAIVTASKYMVSGHVGIAEMYKVLASAAKDPEDAAKFLEAEASHREMATKSSNVVVPDVSTKP